FARLGGPDRLWRPAGPDAAAAGPSLLAIGAVIAVVDLVDCHPAVGERGRVCCAPWGERWHGAAARPAHHLIFSDVRVLPRPVPCPGRQITPWLLPPAVAEAVEAQLTAQ
ncbi:hypothetical protein, partial [Dactylosporangium sucinum]